MAGTFLFLQKARQSWYFWNKTVVLCVCVCVCILTCVYINVSLSEWQCRSCTMVNAASSILCEVCERPRLATRPPVTPSHPPVNPPRPPAPVLGMPGDPDSQVSYCLLLWLGFFVVCVCLGMCIIHKSVHTVTFQRPAFQNKMQKSPHNEQHYSLGWKLCLSTG